MLRTEVILSRVTNLSDARYAAGMGVNYIGFDLNPWNNHYVTPEQVKMITKWISGVSFIGEIGDQQSVVAEDYPIDILQTNNVDMIEQFDNPILHLKVAADTGDFGRIIESANEKVSIFNISFPANQYSLLIPQLKDICKGFPVFLGTDYTIVDVMDVLTNISPRGIVLYGSKEEQTGLSSYDGIADILEQIEMD